MLTDRQKQIRRGNYNRKAILVNVNTPDDMILNE